MVFVYDTLVNFNEELIDFYDWNESDEFTHIRRVPLLKVSECDYFNLVTRKVRLGEDTLNFIKDKTQMFSNRGVEVLKYVLIVTDGKGAITLDFNDNGVIRRKSKFLVNEEIEILDMAKSIKVSDIKYEIISKNIVKNKMIRSEKVIVEDILNELNSIKDNQKVIDYLYYEWFDRSDGDNKYDKLVKDLSLKYTDKHLDFLELLSLVTKTKVNLN